jgi:hypothetical protein
MPRAASTLGTGSRVPGMTGKPAAWAMLRAMTLSPKASSTAGEGPMN